MNTVVIRQILKECISPSGLNRINHDSSIREQKASNVAHHQRFQIFAGINKHFHDDIKETIITGFKTIEEKLDGAKTSKDDSNAYEKLLRSLW